MMGFETFLILAYTFGPAAAIPYAAASSFDLSFVFIILFALYIIPLPIIYYLFDLMDCRGRCKSRIVYHIYSRGEKVSKRSFQRVMNKFSEKWGYLGYYLFLIFFAFAMGFLWAVIFAYIMGLEKQRAFWAITIGNFFGLLFWTGVTIFSVTFIHPNFFLFFFITLALTSFAYGEIRERQIIEKAIIMANTAVRKTRKRIKS